MASKRPSNPLALAVLTLLSEKPMHPYEMSSTLRERQKEESIKLNFGSLYSVVVSLEKRELIEATETIREGNRPERTVYRISGAGKTMMVEWLSDLLSTPVKEFPQFEAALSLMPALPPDDVISLLERRLAQQQETYQANKTLLDKGKALGMPRVFSIEHEYELALLNAEIEFLRQLIDDMRSGTLSGLKGWRRMAELRSAGMPMEEIEAVISDEFKEDFAWLEHLDELR
ncbi:PadR family transcriptional regulator [Phytoactinopolyspora mesophila]|uniref:PadR family transcriptional regulator n=1 Tax=Phytoactinopolyspora mesophila TaxID=2650750 RepID=A0A7K3M575_9ACTN|nr:PadR family transcriptional regulator [Phytoactinopolyspora mesophila]NDL58395.1 PadR family transcriptional regulator [Phytoactinopolyspora mesophila]